MKNSDTLYRRHFHIPSSFFFICGIILLIYEISKQLLLTFLLEKGTYNWWYFPFQLCSIPMYLSLVFPWCKRESVRNTVLCFLATYSLLSGIIVFADTSGLHYPLLFLTVSSYVWHILLIVLGLAAGLSLISGQKQKQKKMSCSSKSSSLLHLKLFGTATLLYLSCCIVAEIINLTFDRLGTINMFYINPHYSMQQIVFRSIVPYAGNTAAIIIYILSTVFGAFLFFIIWKLFFRIACLREKSFS